MKRRKTDDKSHTKKKQKGLSLEEQKAIETGISDYSKCARKYINNLLNNSFGVLNTQFEKKDNEIQETDDWFKYEQTSKQVKHLKPLVENTNPENKKLYEQFEKISDNMQTGIVSNIVESIFNKDGSLNRQVVREGAIVRVWSCYDQSRGAEWHSTATIDYGERRVSFGTSLHTDVEILLKGEKLGNAHVINSPDDSFIKQVLFNGDQNKPISGLALIAMGYLTEEHIKNIKDALIDDAAYYEFNSVDMFIESSENKGQYFPIIATSSLSKSTFYNKYTLYKCVDTKDLTMNFTDEEKDYDPKKFKIHRRDKYRSMNCSELMKLLFPGIVCVNSSHMVQNLRYFVMGSATIGPPSLIPTKAYTCNDDNTIGEPPLVSLQIGRGLMCNFFSMNKYVAIVVYTTLYLIPGGVGGLILPLIYTPSGTGWTDLLFSSTIISSALAALTSFKVYFNKSKLPFSFGKEDILSIEELKDLYGKEDTEAILELVSKVQKSDFGFNSSTKKSSRRVPRKQYSKRRSRSRRVPRKQSSKRRSRSRRVPRKQSSKRRSRSRRVPRKQSSKRRSRSKRVARKQSSKRRSRSKRVARKQSSKRRSRSKRVTRKQSSKRRSRSKRV